MREVQSKFKRIKTTAIGLAAAILSLAAQPVWAQCTLPTVTLTGGTNADPNETIVLNNFTPDTSTLAGDIIATNLSAVEQWSDCAKLTYTRPASPTTILGILGGNTVEEIGTSGSVVWSVTMQSVNKQLKTMNQLQIIDFNHEAIRLPNGWTAMIGHVEELVECSQYPAQCPTGPTVGNDIDVMGSAVVVVNSAGTVQWYWNPFVQLSLARPAVLGETCTPHTNNGGCPVKLAPVANDWTHSNSLWFDPVDSNLAISIRNQDWVVKVNFNNGLGSGDIIWHLGNEGDFTLAPTSVVWPWFSHQHDVTSFTPGMYTMFDNGNTRVSPPPLGVGSGTSRGQAYSIDEAARTATLTYSQTLDVYSPGSGTAQVLSNGNYWFLAGRPLNSKHEAFSEAVEVTPGGVVVYEEKYTVKQYRSSRFANLFTFATPSLILGCPATSAQVAAEYSSNLNAAGGTPPYSFLVLEGALPPGLTLSGSTGAITGAPSIAGSSSFTAQVFDSTGIVTTANCAIGTGATSTSTVLSATPNPAAFGQGLVMTAEVSPAPSSGVVTFYDGVTIVDSAPVVGGAASLATYLLPSGSGTLHAVYEGSASFNSSSSAPVSVAVQAVPASTLLPAVPYSASGSGASVVTGDFNGDGIADFAVGSGGINVFPGNGNGTFGAPVLSAAGATPVALAIGDFNGDGLLDLAAVYSSGSVSILLGEGDGSFQAPVSYTLGTNPTAVAVADFNGDGHADLAVAYAGGAAILLGNGDGTFRAAVTYAAGSGPASIAAADFNGDGKADVAVANAGDGTVSILLGNGDGTLQPAIPYAAGASPQSLAVADLNGDGYADVAVANSTANTVSVLFGNGNGTLNPPVTYATGMVPRAVAIADVNGDSIPDLVTADTGDGTVGVLLGSGGGVFQAEVGFASTNAPAALAVANFNGDNRTDIVAVGGSSATAAVLLGGQVTPSVTVTSSANPASPGQSVTFTATVAPTAPSFATPTGTVTFSDGGTALPGGVIPLSGGSASLSVSTLGSGVNSIVASYGGDTRFAPATSAPLPQTVE
jgi:hypothetical protein